MLRKKRLRFFQIFFHFFWAQKKKQKKTVTDDNQMSHFQRKVKLRYITSVTSQ